MSNKRSDFWGGFEGTASKLYVILGLVGFALHISLTAYTDLSPVTLGISIMSAYVLACLIIFLIARRRVNLYKIESNASEEQNNGVVYTFRNSIRLPYAVINGAGKIITVNSAFKAAIGMRGTFFNYDITSLLNVSLQDIFTVSEESLIPLDSIDNGDDAANSAEKTRITVSIRDMRYSVDCHQISTKGKTYFMLTFYDITELLEVKDRYVADTAAVCYVVLDNLEEIAQYVKVSYQAEAAQVERILKDFADEMGGILREYDRNKYMLLLSQEKLEECIKNKFEILDTVREVRIGEDNMPITISMGIATVGNTLAAREREALVALDMALQRGGDQVVVKNSRGTNFFGGRTKTQQKRSGGHSRIIATRLCSMISGSSNVIVMGHSNPDFDSIGACVGIAALSMHLGVDVKIVTNTETENFLSCTERLRELPEYRNIFVDGVVGLGEISFGTLLVIVDANNFSILEAPEIAANSFKTAVIDHHIKKEEFKHEPQLTYIDPSASSACELISELLEQTLPAGVLRKEEANVIMSGIMVDTKNFTRTVGTRTFAAALYLRSCGGGPEQARVFFEEAFDDFKCEAQFGSNTSLYRDCIGITFSEGTGSPHDRIAAAKASDKLLTVRQIHAAFALVRIGDVVHISGRSDGSINVQLILERIGGGGHFDMAGAAIGDRSLASTVELLKGAIDGYLEDTASKD